MKPYIMQHEIRSMFWFSYRRLAGIELSRRLLSAVLAGDSAALQYAFSWANTPQGADYWEFFCTHPEVPLPIEAREFILAALRAIRSENLTVYRDRRGRIRSAQDRKGVW